MTPNVLIYLFGAVLVCCSSVYGLDSPLLVDDIQLSEVPATLSLARSSVPGEYISDEVRLLARGLPNHTRIYCTAEVGDLSGVSHGDTFKIFLSSLAGDDLAAGVQHGSDPLTNGFGEVGLANSRFYESTLKDMYREVELPAFRLKVVAAKAPPLGEYRGNLFFLARRYEDAKLNALATIPFVFSIAAKKSIEVVNDEWRFRVSGHGIADNCISLKIDTNQETTRIKVTLEYIELTTGHGRIKIYAGDLAIGMGSSQSSARGSILTKAIGDNTEEYELRGIGSHHLCLACKTRLNLMTKNGLYRAGLLISLD